MSDASKCIITGCRLRDNAEERTLWGDLHVMLGVDPPIFIFDGVTTQRGHADWKHEERAQEEREIVILESGQVEWVEKRGICVIPMQPGVHLNELAMTFIRQWEPELAKYLVAQRVRS